MASPAVGSSLIAFIIVYAIVFAAGMFYIFRLMREPPHPGEEGPRPVKSRAHPASRRRPPCSLHAWGERGARHDVSFDLTVVFAFIIAFAVFAYVVMDGFDLGVALMFPFFPERRDRDVMMNSVAPVWDGNETWLVLGGGALFAAFPLAYAILMPAIYTPAIAMLLGARVPRRRV